MRYFSHAVILGLLCSILGACGGIGGTVGGGSIAPETSFRIEGTPNTAFSGVITDTVASWPIVGVVPLNVVILNNTPPVMMSASKLTGDSSILSVEIVSGDQILRVESTSAPFGTAVLQTQSGITTIAPRANPDMRFFVKGAPGEYFNGLIEDLSNGFALGDFARTLYLFERPKGRVDGFFNLPNFIAGPLDVDLSIDGTVVATAHGVPSVSLKSP